MIGGSPRVRLWLLGIAAVALACADLVLTLTSHHAELRGINGPLGAMIVIAFVATGLFAWSRRPDNRVGKLMVATGLAWGGVGLAQGNSAVLYSIGGAIGPLYLVFVTWLILAFPDGRVGSRLGRALLVVGFIDVLVIYELGVLLDIDTGDNVPDNLFAVVHAPGLAGAFDTASAAIGAVIIATVARIVMVERRRATPVAQHAAAPMLRTGLVCLTAVAISLGIGSLGVSDTAHGIAGSIAALAFFALPFAYLIGLLRSRYARAGRVSDLLDALSSRAALRDTLAEALGDPSLRLVYWTGRWVDREGRPVELPAAGVTEVDRDGQRIGAIVHDPALHEEPELVHAVAAAAALALDNERLEAELRARVVELQESRSKLIEVSMAERRSLERDLHDGAQQRLVALSVQVGLAKRKLHSDPAAAEELLDRAGDELRLALEELRELARGIHPAILTDRGLNPALQALIDRAPLDVELADGPAERLPAPIEAAAYFVVAESLTNVAKYAGAAHAYGVGRAPERPRGRRGPRRRHRRRRPRCGDRPARAGGAPHDHRRAPRRREPSGRRNPHPGEDPMRVVLADDSVLLREGVARLLEDAGMEVVAQAGDGEDLLRKVSAHKPDVAVVDVRMPPTHTDEGLRAAAEIRERFPNTGVLVLSAVHRGGPPMELLSDSAEGLGYLLKDRVSDLDRFVDAVRRVGEGGSALDPEVVSRLLGRQPPRRPARRAEPREREVLGLMAEGRSNHAIAEQLVDHRTRGREARDVDLLEARAPADPAEDHRRVLAVLAYMGAVIVSASTCTAATARARRRSTRCAASRSPRRAGSRRHGPVGLRQVDAHAHPRRARPPDVGDRRDRRDRARARSTTSALTDLRRDKVGFVFQAFNLLPVLTPRRTSCCRCDRRAQARPRVDRPADRRDRHRRPARPTGRRSSPAASSSASPSPARWRRGPR